MTRNPVTSKHIISAGYDPDAKEMEVEFTNGDVWRYPGITEGYWNGFNKAKSQGKFFHSHVKRVAGTRARKLPRVPGEENPQPGRVEASPPRWDRG